MSLIAEEFLDSKSQSLYIGSRTMEEDRPYEGNKE
jgi:hypothetical protein